MRRRCLSIGQLFCCVALGHSLSLYLFVHAVFTPFDRTCTMVGTFINLVLSMVGIANLEEAAAEMIPVFLDALVLVMRKGFS